MQAYGENFARIYNARWANYAEQVAPLIREFYAATPIGRTQASVLDLCCGAGHLAVHFLEHGYRVVGIDLSEPMLAFARENAGRFLESGQAQFIRADAADFTLDERFGLVVSTYDSLNHLENEHALRRYFECVRAVSDGYFIFDLNTRKGLHRWNGTRVDDDADDALIIARGSYDGRSERAWMRFIGFTESPDGTQERFNETVYNIAFDLERVKAALVDIGWKDVYFARGNDLSTPLAEPEEEGRVFVIASVS